MTEAQQLYLNGFFLYINDFHNNKKDITLMLVQALPQGNSCKCVHMGKTIQKKQIFFKKINFRVETFVNNIG